MPQDGQLSPGALDALRERFERQSRTAQTYYTVMHAIKGVLGNDEAASAWMNAPLPDCGGKTPAELIGEGRADAVLAQVRTLRP
jgi:uncharacterized protein (DUF2384 family)